MRIFEDFKLHFEEANWKNDPELALSDNILQAHPELKSLVDKDIRKGERQLPSGGQDSTRMKNTSTIKTCLSAYYVLNITLGLTCNVG